MNESDDSNSPKFELDCAVCLQKCNHPTQLPCGHVFCFLCVKYGHFLVTKYGEGKSSDLNLWAAGFDLLMKMKMPDFYGTAFIGNQTFSDESSSGIAFQSKKCAMCRADIPPTYLDNPILLGTLPVEQVNINPTQELYQWFYEGRNGWWKYDERSNFELESAFNSGDPDCTLLLAGTLYNIDFQSMTQVRRSDQTRRRRVRRDTPMFPSKGIAGIKTDDTTAGQVKSDDEESPDVVHVPIEDEIIEISDDETSVHIEPVLTHQEDVNHVIDRIRSVNLQEPNVSQDLNQEET